MTPRLYKATDVCQAAGLQPYVLRSWEKEFPGIGVQRSPDSPRLYRQSDVEQVLRIKQLVFGEGLTLAGARRRLEESAPARTEASDVDVVEVLDTLGADARSRIAFVRAGLRSILHVLSRAAGTAALPPSSFPNGASRKAASAGESKPGRRAAAARTERQRSAAKNSRSSTPKRRATPKRAAPARKSGGKRKRVVQRY